MGELPFSMLSYPYSGGVKVKVTGYHVVAYNGNILKKIGQPLCCCM